jgi:hypothetical protein
VTTRRCTCPARTIVAGAIFCAFCGGILPAGHRGHPIDNPLAQVSAIMADRPELFHVPERDFPAATSATTYALAAPPPAVPVAQVMRRPVMAPRRPPHRGWVFRSPVVVNAPDEAQEH